MTLELVVWEEQVLTRALGSGKEAGIYQTRVEQGTSEGDRVQNNSLTSLFLHTVS